MIDRDRFAAEIYLVLLKTHPSKTHDEWRQDEAVRQANAFADKIESAKPKKSRRKEFVSV